MYNRAKHIYPDGQLHTTAADDNVSFLQAKLLFEIITIKGIGRKR